MAALFEVAGYLTVFFFVALLLFIFAGLAIRIVSPYQKGLVVRLGRYQRTAESGLHLIVPFVETLKKVDMRETVIDVPPQDLITKDNASVTVDAVIYGQIIDPVKSSYNVVDFRLASTKLAQTT